MRFIDDDKLPSDVLRKQYSEFRQALCCLNCGIEPEFEPHMPRYHWEAAVCSDGARLSRIRSRELMTGGRFRGAPAARVRWTVNGLQEAVQLTLKS